ncbi:MAG: hypothetical protein J7L88_05650, partial [Thermoplasmata archaeon]|nr:hypothetical protein [Thermoplasmata archaeon]
MTGMRPHLPLIISAFVLLIPLISSPGEVSAEEDKGGHIAEWTIMVYLDADNNLESAGIEDFNEMEEVGSTEEVNIVVEMDRHDKYDTSNGDWKGTRIYYVVKDNDKNKISSEMLVDLNETNMGDPQVLVDFVRFSVERYPAKKYMLVLWDHGGAFRGVCYDENNMEGKTDALNMSDLRTAMEKITGILGRRIDILGFDACLMAEVAVLYQIKEFEEVVLASGFSEPGDGWPYKEILERLVQRPEMSREDLSKIVVEQYIKSYTDRQDDPQDSMAVTMTAFNMRRFPMAAEAISRLAMELSTQVSIRSVQIWTARSRTTGYDLVHVGPFDLTNYPLYDIVDFCDKLQQYIPFDNRIKDMTNEVKTAIGGAVILAKADPYHPGAHGLTIYFPNRESPTGPAATIYDPKYGMLDFGREKFWDNFLQAYYQLKNIRDPPPSVTLSGPDWNRTYTYSDSLVVIEGVAFDLK